MQTEKNTPELGKVKEEFQQWYEANLHEFYRHSERGMPRMPYEVFINLPFPFQQGVYLEFFRKKWISIETYYLLSGHWVGEVLTIHSEQPFLIRLDRVFKSIKDDYNTALIAAIEAAAKSLETTPEC